MLVERGEACIHAVLDLLPVLFEILGVAAEACSLLGRVNCIAALGSKLAGELACDPRWRAIEAREVLDNRLDGGDDLDPCGAGADDSNILVG